MLRFEWNNDKNEYLKKNRDIYFEDVKRAILEDKVLDVIPHFSNKYPHQEVLIIILHNYVHYVPFVQDDKKIFFKTIVPSRKLNKIYNKKDK